MSSGFSGWRAMLLAFLCLGVSQGVHAEEPQKHPASLEEVGKQYDELSSSYRESLKTKKSEVEDAMKSKEEALITETHEEKRVALVNDLRSLRDEREDLNDKIRVINAGEVVKLSNKKDKVIAFLTNQ